LVVADEDHMILVTRFDLHVGMILAVIYFWLYLISAVFYIYCFLNSIIMFMILAHIVSLCNFRTYD